MPETIFTPKDTFYRKVVNLLKSNYTLLVFLKILNPGRRIEIANIKRRLLTSDSGNGSLLDVGCGDGYWSRYFSKYASKVVGIEPYEVDLKKAQQYAIPNTEFLFATAEKMPFNDKSFDKIVSVCVFEHLYDDLAAFREFHRVLSDKGIVLATVDSLNSPYVSKEHIEWHMSACYCKQLYTIEGITDKLKAAGFGKVEAFYIMGSRVSVFWEILMEKTGVFAFILLPIFWPLIMVLEGGEKKSGYKIFVKAAK
jgi:SAM-dependent methyltransferase